MPFFFSRFLLPAITAAGLFHSLANGAPIADEALGGGASAILPRDPPCNERPGESGVGCYKFTPAPVTFPPGQQRPKPLPICDPKKVGQQPGVNCRMRTLPICGPKAPGQRGVDCQAFPTCDPKHPGKVGVDCCDPINPGDSGIGCYKFEPAPVTFPPGQQRPQPRAEPQANCNTRPGESGVGCYKFKPAPVTFPPGQQRGHS